MEDWLRKRVRIWPGYDWRREGNPVAEGVVIAWTDQPTIVVRDDHGNDTHHVATLPIEVVAEEQPIPPLPESMRIPADFDTGPDEGMEYVKFVDYHDSDEESW
jgi:hypothetical protein